MLTEDVGWDEDRDSQETTATQRRLIVFGIDATVSDICLQYVPWPADAIAIANSFYVIISK